MADSSPDRQQIFQQISEIVKDILFSEAGRLKERQAVITMTTDIYTDLGMDSVESLDFLTALEEEFGVNPDQVEASRRRTIAQIVDYIEELLAVQRIRRKGK